MSVRTVKMFKSDVRSVPLGILMKFDVDDKNRCRLVCVKFHLNRRRFAAAVAICLGGSLFLGHSVCLVYTARRDATRLKTFVESGRAGGVNWALVSRLIANYFSALMLL